MFNFKHFKCDFTHIFLLFRYQKLQSFIYDYSFVEFRGIKVLILDILIRIPSEKSIIKLIINVPIKERLIV